MQTLRSQLARLPTRPVAGQPHLACQAATDTVAAFLFPGRAADQIDAAGYRQILETADTLCRELGYQSVVKLTPPTVPFSDAGLYWTTPPYPTAPPAGATEAETVIIAGPGRVAMLAEGLLLDAHLSRLGLDEVTRQHFNIPVTASEGVLDLMHRAVNAAWPNDYRGIWHDILGMCVAGGRDINATERLFTVIVRGLGQRRYWRFKAQIQQDDTGAPFLYICLADEAAAADEATATQLFPLGHVVMTPGVAALEIDVAPYLARHAAGDWGALTNSDKRQNDAAVKGGYRILSAYDVPLAEGETARLWVITEADRSVTTALLPSEY